LNDYRTELEVLPKIKNARQTNEYYPSMKEDEEGHTQNHGTTHCYRTDHVE